VIDENQAWLTVLITETLPELYKAFLLLLKAAPGRTLYGKGFHNALSRIL